MDRIDQLNADHLPVAAPPARIACLDPPYGPDVEALLFGITSRTSPREPLKLFRLIARDQPLCDLMFRLGRFMLGRNTAVAAGYDTRTRELVIDRVTARCGCEYEWGVHMAAYRKEAGITAAQAYSLVYGTSADLCWFAEDRATLSFVDDLHDTGHVSDAVWAEMSARFSDETLIELLVLVGWYHTISYLASGTRTERESWAHRFPEDVRSPEGVR
jgi:alkylhydroperoxidase family enzyme